MQEYAAAHDGYFSEIDEAKQKGTLKTQKQYADSIRAAKASNDVADLVNESGDTVATVVREKKSSNGKKKAAQAGGKVQLMARDRYGNVVVDEDVDSNTVSTALRIILDNKMDKANITFPVLKHTPPVFMDNIRWLSGDSSFVMNSDKAYQAMSKDTPDGHALGLQGLMEAIYQLYDPEALIMQNFGQNKGHLAAIVSIDGGKRFASIDLGDYREVKDAVNGEPGYYNVVITAFDPDDPNYFKKLRDKRNDIYYDKATSTKKYEVPEHVALGDTPAGLATETSSIKILTEAAEKSKSKLQESARTQVDRDYMAAVNRGDMETAQRMVDEAAKAAGYTIKAWHGSRYQFNEFSRAELGKSTGTEASKRWFFAADYDTANSYYPAGVMRELMKQNPKMYSQKDIDRMEKRGVAGKLYSLYIKMENPLDVDVAGYDYEAHREKADAMMEYVEQADRDGNDGIILRNVRDNNLRPSEESSTDYMFKDPSQAKSAEPVTYDDDGNVIPLSQRFNSSMGDIRYSTRGNLDKTGLDGYNIQAENNYKHLMEVFSYVDRKGPGGGLRNDAEGERSKRIVETYQKPTVESAKARNEYCNAVRRAGGITARKISLGYSSGTANIISPAFYTVEMLQVEAANKARGLDTSFYVDRIVDEYGDEWLVNGFADTDAGVVYVRYNADNTKDGSVRSRRSFNAPEIAKLDGVQTSAQNSLHERFHLMEEYLGDKYAQELTQFIDDPNGKHVKFFDTINYWYQAVLPQGGYSFSDYSHEIAADLYAGTLHLHDKGIQREVEEIVARIDGGTRLQYQQRTDDRSDRQMLEEASEAGMTDKQLAAVHAYRQQAEDYKAREKKVTEALRETDKKAKSRFQAAFCFVVRRSGR